MTRTGKIARLPYVIREELNQRLLDGEPGVRLVKWLNQQEAAQFIVKDEYDGVPISEQNLSEWKAGGYQSWLNNREAKELVLELVTQAKDLNEAMEGEDMAEILTTLLLAEMLKLAKVLMQQEENTEKRWAQLKEVNHEILKLRRMKVREGKARVVQERWEAEEDERQRGLDKEEVQERREKLLAPLQLPFQALSLAPMYGGGKGGETIARRILEIKHDLPLGLLDGSTKDGNWKLANGDWEWAGKKKNKTAGGAPSPQPSPPVGAREAKVKREPMIESASQIRPNPTESYHIKPERKEDAN